MGPMVADRRFGSCGARPTGCGWWFTGRRVAAADDPVIGHPRTLLIFLGAEVCACVQPAKTWSTWVLVAADDRRTSASSRPRRRAPKLTTSSLAGGAGAPVVRAAASGPARQDRAVRRAG